MSSVARLSRRFGYIACMPRHRLILISLSLALAAAIPAIAAPGAGAASLVPTVTTSNAAHATYSSVIRLRLCQPRTGSPRATSFQYGTTTGYGGADGARAGRRTGAISVKVGQAITGLQPGTALPLPRSWRSMGRDWRTAATARSRPSAVPLSLQITSTPNPVTFGEPVPARGQSFGHGRRRSRGRSLRSEPVSRTWPGFRTIGNPELTNATGGFSFPYLGLLENAQLSVVHRRRHGRRQPGRRRERRRARVTFHAKRTRRRGYRAPVGDRYPGGGRARSSAFSCCGPATPSTRAAPASKPGTATTSRFERVVHVRHPGVYRALVKINDPARVSAYSPPIYIR